MKNHDHELGANIREFIFGIEDGIIGNLGVVVGLARAAAPNKIILLAGVATMFAQAISMGVGNYLSVQSEKEYFDVRKKERDYGKAYSRHKSLIYSTLVMAFSVIIGTAIPLSVFLVYESQAGIIPAIIVTLLGLFALGAIKTKYTFRHWLISGLEMMLVGGLAATVGFLIGTVFA
ncbi:VIT1/CCC1 transporter family protein [Candidatus Woesearchaeota archaeon]|nr:VIT1/CCC1 transporter family protein [Candidatus Woesearchaeota archaeon]